MSLCPLGTGQRRGTVPPQTSKWRHRHHPSLWESRPVGHSLPSPPARFCRFTGWFPHRHCSSFSFGSGGRRSPIRHLCFHRDVRVGATEREAGLAYRVGWRTGDKKGIGLFVFQRRYEGEKEGIAIQVIEREGGRQH